MPLNSGTCDYCGKEINDNTGYKQGYDYDVSCLQCANNREIAELNRELDKLVELKDGLNVKIQNIEHRIKELNII